MMRDPIPRRPSKWGVAEATGGRSRGTPEEAGSVGGAETCPALIKGTLCRIDEVRCRFLGDTHRRDAGEMGPERFRRREAPRTQ